MGSLSAANAASARQHAARIRKVLDDAGYHETRIDVIDAGRVVSILWKNRDAVVVEPNG